MSDRVSGDPTRLEGYTKRTKGLIAPERASNADYSEAVRAFINARPNSFGTRVFGLYVDRGRALNDRRDTLDGLVDRFDHLDARPAALAFALRQIDSSDKGVRSTEDLFRLEALTRARLDMPLATDTEVRERAAQEEKAVQDALAYFHDHIDDDSFWSGDRDALRKINDRLRSLTPEERDELIRRLSPGDLTKWNKKIHDVSDFLGHAEGLTTDDRTALANMLLSDASPDTVAKVLKYLPSLEPDVHAEDFKKNFPDAGYRPSDQLPLFGSSGRPDAGDIVQGDDGDCWFLAGLGSVAQINPELLKNNIRQNANGTFTVTFYKDGHPVEITVSDDMSYSGKNRNYTFDQPGSGDNAKWAMIYEKAYAQFKGGYGSIEGGFGDRSLSDITGQHATREDPSDHSLSDIADKLQNGYAVTSGSKNSGFLWWESDRSDNNQIVTNHEYMVKSVDRNAHPPTITLVNPWGPNGSAPYTVTLTEDEWHRYFGEVSMAKVR